MIGQNLSENISKEEVDIGGATTHIRFRPDFGDLKLLHCANDLVYSEILAREAYSIKHCDHGCQG